MGFAPLSGTYRLVDTITAGPGSGSTYTFDVTLSETTGPVAGRGDGFSITGARSGDTVFATFTRPGGSGSFVWVDQGDGTYAGTFHDDGVGNSGVSPLIR